MTELKTETSTTAGAGVDAEPPPPRRREKNTHRVRPYLLGTSSLVVLLAVWQIVVVTGTVRELFLPRPWTVFRALGHLFTNDLFWSNLGVTAEEFALGMGIAIVVGVVVGIAMGWYKPIDEFLKPVVTGLNAMPSVAIIPILILILGIGTAPKVVVVAITCSIVISMNTAAGVANVDPQLMRLAKSVAASDVQMIRTVVFPSVIPYFMAGVRISIGKAMIGVIVGEFFASKAGLGHMMISASNSFNMPLMYAIVLFITALGIALTKGAEWLEKRLQAWRE